MSSLSSWSPTLGVARWRPTSERRHVERDWVLRGGAQRLNVETWRETGCCELRGGAQRLNVDAWKRRHAEREREKVIGTQEVTEGRRVMVGE
jgi:hypothetical protein